MIENELIGLVTNNLVGVVFGLLMYRMATTTIKDNTKAIVKLTEVVGRMK